MSPLQTAPQPGQIVEVRQLRFVVSDVRPMALPVSPLHASMAGIEHLVTLSSIEDDALGEELQVIWEVEVGTRLHQGASPPSPTNGCDDPRRLDDFLDAVRWGAASIADVRAAAITEPTQSGVGSARNRQDRWGDHTRQVIPTCP